MYIPCGQCRRNVLIPTSNIRIRIAGLFHDSRIHFHIVLGQLITERIQNSTLKNGTNLITEINEIEYAALAEFGCML